MLPENQQIYTGISTKCKESEKEKKGNPISNKPYFYEICHLLLKSELFPEFKFGYASKLFLFLLSIPEN